jgi:hypothetical protein
MPEARRPELATPGAADGSGKNLAALNSAKYTSRQLRRQEPRFHRLTERVHRLGPRPVGELLLEVAAGRDLIEAPEDYARHDPEFVAYVGARDRPPSVWGAAA